jgi:DNA polymerase I-like protein with 3'-5' exonuclease and polymerase domains
LYQKRIAQIQSWLDALEKDGRVHGSVIPNGTITGRMSHNHPNLAQVPSVHNPFGKECRACWSVEEGNVLLGVDASGLELRMLAHYMNDKEYINEVVNGDIHTTNQKLAGLESRDTAKTFIYALVYGAGDEKIGSVVGGTRKKGKELKERFLNNLPTFKTLKDRVQRAAKRGFLKGIDGRKIYIRHEHAALNSLLQGGGAIVMKKGLEILERKLKLRGMDFKFVANIHDEWQLEVPDTDANNIGDLAVLSLREAGEHFEMRCPLDGEYKIGGNWSETH